MPPNGLLNSSIAKLSNLGQISVDLISNKHTHTYTYTYIYIYIYIYISALVSYHFFLGSFENLDVCFCFSIAMMIIL